MTTQEEEIKEKIQLFLENFNGHVSDISYDGWPIWWFFKKRFIGDLLIFPLPKNQNIAESIFNQEDNNLKRVKDALTVFGLRKFTLYNEKIKFLIAKFNKKRSLLKTDKNKKRIMFLAHTNGIIPDREYGFTVDRIGSVVKEVRKDSDFEEYISVVDPLSFNSGLKLLKYENLIYRYIDEKIHKKAKDNSYELNKKWIEISGKIKYDSELDGKIFDRFRPALEVFFSREMIYLIILYYETYKKMMSQEKIKFMCFYSGSDILSKCAIAGADKLDIKSLHITHGFSIPQKNPDQPSSVYFAVFGSRFKEKLIKLGVASENIFVTGPTFMDETTPYITGDKSKKGCSTILLATSNFVEINMIEKRTYFEYISKFLREIDNIGNIKIIIKLHPLEKNIDLYESIVTSQGYKNVKIVEGRGENQLKTKLYELIYESDIVMSFGSTVSEEAMIISRPSVIIDLLPVSSAEYRKSLIHISPKEDISKIVYPILHNSKIRKKIIFNQKKILRKYFYKLDGKNGERVVKQVKELIKGPKRKQN